MTIGNCDDAPSKETHQSPSGAAQSWTGGELWTMPTVFVYSQTMDPTVYRFIRITVQHRKTVGHVHFRPRFITTGWRQALVADRGRRVCLSRSRVYVVPVGLVGRRCWFRRAPSGLPTSFSSLGAHGQGDSTLRSIRWTRLRVAIRLVLPPPLVRCPHVLRSLWV
jgi:hypothetical protein